MNNKSFTLIELLVVIVIIGILAGVIMISTSSSIDKANIAKLKVFEESVANDLAADMVSRWKLDEVINTNQTPDQWGGNTGTIYNALPQPSSECVSGNCFKFDGSGDSIAHSSITFSSSNSWTNSHWLNWQGFGTNQAYVFYMGIVGTADALMLRSNYDDQFCIRNSVSAYYCFSSGSSSSFYRKGWFHLTWVASSGNLSLYINGKFFQKIIADTSIVYNRIGMGYSSSGGYDFNGLIDDVRIYDAALSSSRIKQNYIAGLDSLLSNGNISKEEHNEKINALAYDKYE